MFKIEIIGIEDFVRFVKFIRDEDLDAVKLMELTDSLISDT